MGHKKTTSNHQVLNDGKLRETGTKLISTRQSKTKSERRVFTEDKLDEASKTPSTIIWKIPYKTTVKWHITCLLTSWWVSGDLLE